MSKPRHHLIESIRHYPAFYDYETLNSPSPDIFITSDLIVVHRIEAQIRQMESRSVAKGNIPHSVLDVLIKRPPQSIIVVLIMGKRRKQSVVMIRQQHLFRTELCKDVCCS